MELENKIKCVLMDFEINEITLQEATKRILLLLSDKGKSKQLVCECCEDNLVEEQGDWCQECLDKPSRVITN